MCSIEIADILDVTIAGCAVSLSIPGWWLHFFLVCAASLCFQEGYSPRRSGWMGEGTSWVNSENLVVAIPLRDTGWQHCTTAAASLGSWGLRTPSRMPGLWTWQPLPSFPSSFTLSWPRSDLVKTPSSSFPPPRLPQVCCFPAPAQSSLLQALKNQRHEDHLSGSRRLWWPVSFPVPCKGRLRFLLRTSHCESWSSLASLTPIPLQRVQWPCWLTFTRFTPHPFQGAHNAVRRVVMVTSMCQPCWAMVPGCLVKR